MAPSPPGGGPFCVRRFGDKKGRIPILVNKLQYGQTDDWNNAPADVNNLTDFVAGLWKKQLNWQTVNIQVAKVEDLLQAPVVQLSGHDAPRQLTVLADEDDNAEE